MEVTLIPKPATTVGGSQPHVIGILQSQSLHHRASSREFTETTGSHENIPKDDFSWGDVAAKHPSRLKKHFLGAREKSVGRASCEAHPPTCSLQHRTRKERCWHRPRTSGKVRVNTSPKKFKALVAWITVNMTRPRSQKMRSGSDSGRLGVMAH